MAKGTSLGSSLVVSALVFAAAAAFPGTAAAADRDCSDFSSQRAAQDYFVSKGGPSSDPDRLDRDRDGVACEEVSCPCGRTPSTSPKPSPGSSPRTRRRLPALFRGRCARGPTPDRGCTSGAVAPQVDADELCGGAYPHPGPIGTRTRRAVFYAYGVRRALGRYAIDRLIPAALGGTNIRRNLWAQPTNTIYRKAAIGRALREAVCTQRVTLAGARTRIVRNWRRALAGTGTYFFNVRQGYLVSPRRIDYCSSGCEYDELTWSGWQTDVATGAGYYAPVVSGEEQGYYPVTIRLSQPRTCRSGVRIYTRLVEDYPADVPSEDFERHRESRWLCNGWLVGVN